MRRIWRQLESKGLVALRYVDNFGKVTETYPANPNGSPNGITRGHELKVVESPL